MDHLNEQATHAKTSKEELSKFDKNFFWVATGVFVFTVTLVKDIFKIETAHWPWLLIVCWILLALSVATIIISFYVSAFKDWAYNRKYLSTQQEIRLNGLPELISRFASIILFCGGLFFLGLFLSCNFLFTNGRIKDDKSAQQPISKNNSGSTNYTSPKNPGSPGKSLKPEIKNINTNTTTTATSTLITKSMDSIIIFIKPDTAYFASSGCKCPPGSTTCRPTCKMKRK